jgi:hypothetical protein
MNSLYYFLGIVASVLAALAMSVYDATKHDVPRRFWRVLIQTTVGLSAPVAVAALLGAAIAFVVLFAASLGRKFC